MRFPGILSRNVGSFSSMSHQFFVRETAILCG
jgi:hypothetical protein